MPFKVEPSKSVVIDVSDAGPDDVLRIINEDGSTLYLSYHRHDSDHGWFVLTPRLTPEYVCDAAGQAAREWLGRISNFDFGHLQAWLEQQESPDLFEAVVARLLAEPHVNVMGGHLDVGETVTIFFTLEVPKMHFYAERHGRWTAPSAIRTIVPIDRFAAVVSFATHRGLPREP